MIAVRLILLIICLLILPLLCGYIWNKSGICRTLTDYCEIYVGGWIVMMSLFEVIAVPLTFLKARFSLAIGIWIIAILFISAKNLHKVGKLHQQGIKVFSFGKIKWSFIKVLIVVFILVQCIMLTCFQHIDDDDAWYVGVAVTSFTTDTINLYAGNTGDLMNWTQGSNYILAPLPVFWAMLAKICMIHPTIFIHTIIPAVLISMAYIIYYMLAKQLFKVENKKIEYFLFFMCLLNIFGFSSTRTTAAMLLLRVWQGKAMLGAVILPLLIYYLMRYRDGTEKIVIWQILSTQTAMCLLSSMGVFIGILTVGIYVCIPLWLKKRMKEGILILLTIVPNIIIGIIYILLSRGII